MIVAKGTHTDGKELILLGLSEENLKRLRRGQPIFKDLAFAGVPFHVAIVYAKDEIELELLLRNAGLVDSTTPRSPLPPLEEDE